MVKDVMKLIVKVYTLELILLNGCESKRKIWKDKKSLKYILRGERNVRYHDRILSNNLNIITQFSNFHLIL